MRLTQAKRLLVGALITTVSLQHSHATADDLFGIGIDQLEAIVVVSPTRRTPTNLQTTPVAISPVSGEEFNQLFAQDIGEIAAYVPNFSAATMAGFHAASFAMRGASETDILVYFDPKVGVIVDDFVIPHVQTQLLEPYDIESIEVLRGPQGTLFGKNTTAGAIVVRTKRPAFDRRSMEGSVRFGRFDDTALRAAVNLPLSGIAALRFAGLYQRSDGYYENGKVDRPIDAFGAGIGDAGQTVGAPVQGDGARVGGRDIFSGRLKLLIEPDEQLSILSQLELVRDRSDPLPVVNTTAADSNQLANDFGFPGVVFGDPLKQAGIHDSSLVNLDKSQRVDIFGAYLNAEYGFGQHRIHAILGYREQKSRLPNEYLGTAYNSFFAATRDDNRQTLQFEARLASERTGPFNYVFGGFFQQNDVEFCVLQQLGLTEFVGTAMPGISDNQNPLLICNKQDASAYGVFSDIMIDLSERLQLGLGARFTQEKKKFTGREALALRQLFPAGDFSDPLDGQDFSRAAALVRRDDKTWKEPTWRTTLGYQYSDDLYGYLLAAKGFKSGGYNDQSGSGGFDTFPLEPFGPEFAYSFELGVRTSLAEDRLRINGTYFYVIYKDFQRSTVVSIPATAMQETRTFNAAEVTATGLELELFARLSERITLRANLGWLDAKYDDFLLDRNLDGEFEDFSNREVVRAPKLTAGLNVTYNQQLRGKTLLRWNVGLLYEDNNTYYYNDDVGPEFDTELEERTILNASVTWLDATEKYSVSLFGKNLTDDRYKTASQAVGRLWTFSNYGPPITYGLELRVRLEN